MKQVMDETDIGGRLDRDGVCMIPRFRDGDWAAGVRQKVEALLWSGDLREASPSMGYADKTNAGVPLLDRRGDGGRDTGMLDIFNAGEAIAEIGELARIDVLQSAIRKAARTPVSLETTNIYINRSITNTRGFHADTYAEKFKVFVYLTDVPDIRYGPYTYVLRSHRPSKLSWMGRRVINKFRRRPANDCVKEPVEDVRHFTGEAGSLIMSNQTGLHRGWPQEEGFSRMLISLSFS